MRDRDKKQKMGTKMGAIEVEAKTIQEAIKMALSRLKASRSEVDIKVLGEENKGLFSMKGTKLAKILVKPKNCIRNK